MARDRFSYIEDDEWYEQGTDYVSMLGYPIWVAFMQENGPYSVIGYSLKNHQKGYFSRGFYRKQLPLIMKKQLKDKSTIDRMYGVWVKELDKLKKILREMATVDIMHADYEEVKRIMLKLDAQNIKVWRKSFISEMVDSEGWAALKNLVEEEGHAVNDDDLKELTHPEERPYLKDLELRLLRLALEAKKEGIDRRTLMGMLKPVTEGYYFIKTGWGHAYKLTEKDFFQELRKHLRKDEKTMAKEIRELEGYTGKVLKAKEKLQKKHKFNKKVMSILYFFTKLAHWRDERKMYCQIVNNKFHDYAARNAKEWGLPLSSALESYCGEKIPRRMASKRKEAVKKMLEERKELNVLYGTEHKAPVMVTGRKAKELMERLDRRFMKQHSEIKGNTGCKGRCVARVKIIKGDKEFHKFKAGEIIVAPMTRPEYIPLMEKAAGIITDEGGLTCHAAIVSRELKIPCIIGTQVATKLLRDGDLVELDADKGMVRKIQKMDPGAELFRWGPIDGKPIYPYTFMQAIEKYPRSSGVSWPNLFLHFKRDRMTFICEYKELRDQGEKLYDMNKDRLAKGHARWQKTVSRLKKHEQAVNKGLSDVPDSELLRLLKSFEQDYLEFWLTGLLPEFTNWGVERLLKDEIMKTHRKDFIEIFEALSAPERLSFFQEEELDFMELKLEEGKKGFANRLKKHAEDYHWLRNSYAHTQRLGEKHFKDGLKEISTEEAREKIKEIKGLPGKVKQNKQEVIKKYSLGKEVVESADWIAYCIWWQDLRKKYIFMSCSIISAFVHEISKRKKIPYEELCYHTPDELLQLLSKGRKADARARQEGFMIYYEKEGRLSFISQDANDLARPFIETRIDKMTEQLRGLVVSKGKGSVRGKVRILLSPRDHMGEGDILVTTMTSPDFVVAMRKAKAIVTDEGGMTSHAAIISRELGIPCIVGTGMATKLLKDGDIVTVDVERGLIRKELCPKSDG